MANYYLVGKIPGGAKIGIKFGGDDGMLLRMALAENPFLRKVGWFEWLLFRWGIDLDVTPASLPSRRGDESS